MSTESKPVRPRRSDARLNAAAIVQAAKTVFTRTGVNAPAKEITDLAGVGVGTMYRHFPRRSDLVTAVLESEIDACAASAERLVTENGNVEVLANWVHQYTALVATKRGLAEALTSHDPGLQGIALYVRERLEPALQTLLDSLGKVGSLRTDLDAGDVMIAIALLSQPVPERDFAYNQRLITAFLRGLR